VEGALERKNISAVALSESRAQASTPFFLAVQTSCGLQAQSL